MTWTTPMFIAYLYCFLCNKFSKKKMVPCRVQIWEKMFLGGAPTPISHFFCLSICLSIQCTPYLKNITSSDHNFWYAFVKWWYLQLFFSFFSFGYFSFRWGGGRGGEAGRGRGCKRTKNSLQWKIIIISVMRHISGTG